ncbi:MAG: hypothetical protein ACU84Q_13450 [Gammaproteobacteria bacterium]
MNWDAVGAIGEVIGAIAVVVSLLYVAVQIRNQNKQSRLNSVNEAARQWNEVLASTASDRALCEVWVEGINDFEGLELVDRTQFTAHAGRVLRVAEAIHEHHKQGRLRLEAWEAMNQVLLDFFAYQGAKDWWKTRCRWYTQSFQRYVESTIEKSTSTPNIYRENNEGV